MCGYCIEYSAITLEPDEGPALLPYLGTTIASVYRPNGPIAWQLAADAFGQEQDAAIREAIALILWLRDADVRLLERLDTSILTLLDLPCDIHEARRRERISEWYQSQGAALLEAAAQNIDNTLLDSAHAARACIAVWAGFHHHRQSTGWLQAVTRIARRVPRPSSPTWSTPLWLRREARLALWEAGEHELVETLDQREDYRPVLHWVGAV